MPVYVDDARYPLGRMLMCHMIADTEHELHAMADRIGVSRRHYQGPSRASHPHYDICRARRTLAVHHGAIELSRREMVRVMRASRVGGQR